MSERFEMRLSEELAGRIDAVRGDVPRATWIKRQVWRALNDAPGPAVVEPEVEAVKALVDAQVPTTKPEVKERELSVPRTTRSSPRTSPPSGPSSDTIPKIARKHWA